MSFSSLLQAIVRLDGEAVLNGEKPHHHADRAGGLATKELTIVATAS
jgi:hypothetical protein